MRLRSLLVAVTVFAAAVGAAPSTVVETPGLRQLAATLANGIWAMPDYLGSLRRSFDRGWGTDR